MRPVTSHQPDLRRTILLGASWVVLSGAISKVTIVITHIKGLITILITAHEPASTPLGPKPHPNRSSLFL